MKKHIIQGSVFLWLIFIVLSKNISAFAKNEGVSTNRNGKTVEPTNFPDIKEKGNFSDSEMETFLKILFFLKKEVETEQERNAFVKGKCTEWVQHESCTSGSSRRENVIIEKKNRDISLKQLLYTDNESWSSCRRSCTATKIRKCRLNGICPVDKLVNKASCYVPGSKCEMKIITEYNSMLNYLPRNDIGSSILYSNENSSSEESDEQYNYSDQSQDTLEQEFRWPPDFEVNNHSGNSFYDDMKSFPEEEYYDYSDQVPNLRSEDSDDHALSAINEGSFSSIINSNKCGISPTSIKSTLFRIIGGAEVIKNSWPWQVAILNRFKEVFCGGTLIADQWVLTAAHCARKRLYVRINEHDIRIPDGEKEYKVKKIIKHPDFDYESIDNDISLLKIPKSKANANRKEVFTACLPSPGELLPKKKSCIALGWGKRRKSHIFGSDVLQYVKVPIVSKLACRRAYRYHEITSNMFCAGRLRGGEDACEGDSGGPLLCENDNGHWVIQGVISFGDGCGDKERLGVYVKVSNYVEWIKKTVLLG